jgi:histidine triad (HIT) family protein
MRLSARRICTAKSLYNDEVSKSKDASQKLEQHTVFSKIISREIPARIIHEDEQSIAFHDISPVAPVHFLVIPKRPIPMLSQATEADTQLLGHLVSVARRLANQQGLTNGYRLVINNGEHGCQSVYHLHIHIMGGRQMTWPPG